MVDTHGADLQFPRRVAGEMNVPKKNKLTYDLVTGAVEQFKKIVLMWIPAGQYQICPEGKLIILT